MAQLLGFVSLIILQGFVILGKSNTLRSRALFLCLSGLEIFLIMGLRSINVGPDTPTYYMVFWGISQFPDIMQFISGMESGYLLFNHILSYFTKNPQVFFMISAAIIVYSGMWLVYKNSPYVCLSVLIYIALGQMAFDMAGMRQALAAAVLFFAFGFLIKKNIIMYLFCVFLASAFHESALFFLAAYPLMKLDLNLKTLTFIFIVTTGAFLLFTSFTNLMFYLIPKYASYGHSFYFEREAKLASYFKTLIAFAVFFFAYWAYAFNREKCKLLDAQSRLRIRLLLYFSLITACVLLISIRATIIERLALYFSFFNIITIPIALSLISNRKIRILSACTIVAMSLTYMIVVNTLRPEWWKVLPYEFFWQTTTYMM